MTGPPVSPSQSPALFGMLLDEIPQGILVVDAAGVVSYHNLAMSVLFPLRSVREHAKLAEAGGHGGHRGAGARGRAAAAAGQGGRPCGLPCRQKHR